MLSSSRRVIFITVAAVLTACGSANNQSGNDRLDMLEAEYGAVQSQSFAKSADHAAPSSLGAQDENPASQSFLAYRYNYSFALPLKAVTSTAKSHAAICLDAGADKCQVLNSSTSTHNEDYASANLQLRAEPAWLESFNEDIQNSVADAKGDMTNSGVSAEDLTRSILDTDARLKAQTTLRARLENLLETRDAKLPDLLALERELARVQGEIESATTTLNVLRKRVSMSIVDINYQTKQTAVSRGALSPISQSLKRFLGNVAGGIGNVIDFVSYVLPWLLFVILPGLWVLRWFWRRRRNLKSKAKPQS